MTSSLQKWNKKFYITATALALLAFELFEIILVPLFGQKSETNYLSLDFE